MQNVTMVISKSLIAASLIALKAMLKNHLTERGAGPETSGKCELATCCELLVGVKLPNGPCYRELATDRSTAAAVDGVLNDFIANFRIIYY